MLESLESSQIKLNDVTCCVYKGYHRGHAAPTAKALLEPGRYFFGGQGVPTTEWKTLPTRYLRAMSVTG